MPDITMCKGTDEECCGGCKHFLYEDTDGIGYCNKHKVKSYCGAVCNDFEEEEYGRKKINHWK